MLAKKRRLTGKEGVIKNGIAFTTPFFSVKAKHSDNIRNRYAVVLGARVSKSSVARHFLKRRVMDELALWPEKFPGAQTGAYDMICIVSPRVTSLSKEKLREELHGAFNRAKEFFMSHQS
jgi:ribonuclease P protein component